MSAPRSPLGAMQRDFRGWVLDEPIDMARWVGPKAQAGLAVYQNNYRSQLVDCLCETFEQVHGWLGDDAFELAARAHIQRNPPHGWTLAAYGEGFDRTLANLYPDDPEVAELAWLDWALSQAFIGPNADPIASERLAEIDWDSATLICAPTMRIGPAITNAGAIWSALSAGDQPPAPVMLPEPGGMLVWRQALTPCFRTIEAVEHGALTLIEAGATFGALCEKLIASLGEADGVRQAGAMLGQWLRDGVIVEARKD